MKGDSLERAKISDKTNYYKTAIKNLRSGRKDIEDLKDAASEKHIIEWDRKRNEHINLIYYNIIHQIIIKICYFFLKR